MAKAEAVKKNFLEPKEAVLKFRSGLDFMTMSHQNRVLMGFDPEPEGGQLALEFSRLSASIVSGLDLGPYDFDTNAFDVTGELSIIIKVTPKDDPLDEDGNRKIFAKVKE